MAGPEFDPPVAPGSTPPPPYHSPPPPPGYAPVAYGYQQPVPAVAGPPNNQAVAALILGIAGLALVVTSTGLLAPVTLPCSILGWVYGSKALNRIRAGETTQGEGIAKAGRICGIIGVPLSVLALLFWVAVIIAAATSDS
jgi:hypothetical protein